jgi:hypothetical protein
LLMPRTAAAHWVSYAFCPVATPVFDDQNTVDDFWNNTQIRFVEGATLTVSTCGGQLLWAGITNLDGCTPSITTTEHQCLSLALVSQGKVDGNNVLFGLGASGAVSATVITFDPPNTSAAVAARLSFSSGVFLATQPSVHHSLLSDYTVLVVGPTVSPRWLAKLTCFG